MNKIFFKSQRKKRGGVIKVPKIPSVTSPDLGWFHGSWGHNLILGQNGAYLRGGGKIEPEMLGRKHSGVKKEKSTMLAPKVGAEIPVGLFSS